MPIDYSDAPWWPPKAGDKLRHFTLHGAGGNRIKHVHALAHVVAVFEHEGRTMTTVAEWFPTKHRWNYETLSGLTARFSYWPDGQPPPEKHEISPGVPCSCCEDDVVTLTAGAGGTGGAGTGRSGPASGGGGAGGGGIR